MNPKRRSEPPSRSRGRFRLLSAHIHNILLVVNLPTSLVRRRAKGVDGAWVWPATNIQSMHPNR
jgi:hypothetical protein